MDRTKNKKRASAAADLTDDLIVEILSRLPVKSVCRFKCVSRHWYGLITGPVHSRRLPQTISGFFYRPYRYWHNQEADDHVLFPEYVSVSGGEAAPFPGDPSLPFLTGYWLIDPKRCCNGLVLCLCRKQPTGADEDEAGGDYVVCNPATEEWFVLPDSDRNSKASSYHLGFDPSVSPHYHVFQILEDEDRHYGGVNIYSSETGAWSHKENGWGYSEILIIDTLSVFLNGILHLLTYGFKVLTVDTQGNRWRTIPLLESMRVQNLRYGPLAFIGQSQGQLCYINMRNDVKDNYTSKLGVWILEDDSGSKWKLKYNISTSQLFGKKNVVSGRDYALMSIHPDCNMIFIVWKRENMLMSYDMDRGKLCVICNLKERYDMFDPYHPYVPFFSVIGSSDGQSRNITQK